MHYKNGRPAQVGDWVVGKTHNSNGHLVIGIVRELMPKQGPCNVRLQCWNRRNMTPVEKYNPDVSEATIAMSNGGYIARPIGDYADAKEDDFCNCRKRRMEFSIF